MTHQTRLLYVQGGRLNVRSSPRIEKDNVTEQMVAGDPLEVLTERGEQSLDGWVWRRLVEHEQRWVAEFNKNSGKRLLDETLPELAEAAEPETLYVMTNVLNVRSSPAIKADNRVRSVKRGQALDLLHTKVVGERGWVWRQIAGDDADPEWIAEYNVRTLERLLSRQPSAGPVRGRVRTEGQRFVLDGRPFSFVGANLREFPFYARTDILPFAKEENQTEQLNAVVDMGMRVIRMHSCHQEVNAQDAKVLLGKALDRIHQHGLLAIVVLNDALGSFWVRGDDRFHRHALGHLDKTAYFHQGGFRENYLPFVREVVSTYADHPAIFAWELGNEYAIHPQPAAPEDSETFFQFVQEVSDLIRTLDPNHLVTIGLVNTGHVAPNDRPGLSRVEYGKRLYSLPNIHFLTVHFYEGNGEEQNSMPDVEIARMVNKPLVVEEWGAVTGDRSEKTRVKIQEWTDHGAAGFLQWGLSATQFNIGVGDNKFGMDPYADGNRHHFPGLLATYRDWAQRLRDLDEGGS